MILWFWSALLVVVCQVLHHQQMLMPIAVFNAFDAERSRLSMMNLKGGERWPKIPWTRVLD
nr:hypothetical protein Iba_chr09bCG13190 [Ipomoea batatas]GMD76329.1 hypothetical protein Iba_chr13bCG9320 [Ipomoea batatas]